MDSTHYSQPASVRTKRKLTESSFALSVPLKEALDAIQREHLESEKQFYSVSKEGNVYQ